MIVVDIGSGKVREPVKVNTMQRKRARLSPGW